MAEETDLKEELDGIYSTLEEAKEEIWKRWNDKELRKKVEDFLDGDVPEFLRDEPKALLVRQITSPDEEFFLFLKLSKNIGLSPFFVEFREDKLVSCNPDKYYRCNMYFHDGKGKNGGHKIKCKKVVDIDFFDGKKIKNVKTLIGEAVLSFHHEILKKAYPSCLNSITDISSWVKRNGKKSKNFYVKYLAWFVCNGVLFENFLSNKEKEFIRNTVLPSVEKIKENFNIKPLIVRTIPSKEEENIFWWYYPKKIENIVNSIIKK